MRCDVMAGLVTSGHWSDNFLGVLYLYKMTISHADASANEMQVICPELRKIALVIIANHIRIILPSILLKR